MYSFAKCISYISLLCKKKPIVRFKVQNLFPKFSWLLDIYYRQNCVLHMQCCLTLCEISFNPSKILWVLVSFSQCYCLNRGRYRQKHMSSKIVKLYMSFICVDLKKKKSEKIFLRFKNFYYFTCKIISWQKMIIFNNLM